MKNDQKQAVEHNKAGLQFYNSWQIEDAIAAFTAAISADPNNPDYHLNLTRAYTRGGDYDQAMTALGGYLQTETKGDVAARYEQLFSTALDEVESNLIEAMKQLDLPLPQVGKAIQMWLEYRITIGRRPLRTSKPALWAGALIYAVVKVNFVEISRSQIAAVLGIKEHSLKEKFQEIVDTLDLMPADYRYFTSEDNPLDKLVEAAQLLEQLDHHFQED
ncbi:MAG: tetratricopeptide repeat protein [Chloroflexi bacterium]|nr:tetratricopeptide repeat protein [Chloroflexota bacterium]